MLLIDWEYLLKKNLRRVKGNFLKARQRGVFSRQRVWRFFGAFLLASFILGASPEVSLEVKSNANSPEISLLQAEPAAATSAGTIAGQARLPTPDGLAAGGQVKGESVFKSLAEKSVRGPERIPDSPDLGEITAKSAFFVDAVSGVVLWEKEPQLPLPLASTTKIMTALMAVDLYPVNEEVTVPAECASLAGTQKMGLLAGEKISVESLLTGMLVSSAGDAACALARHKGTEEEFVKKMNEKSQSLGMAKTHFANPIGNDGIEGNGNEGTAADLMLLAQELWKNTSLRGMAGLTEKTVTSIDGKASHYLKTTNDLLTGDAGIKGIKTGYTTKAKGCFVSYYERGGHPVFGVLLGSDDRFGETAKVLDWIFAVYRWP